MCCDLWGRKESDTAEQLNCTELKLKDMLICVCQGFTVYLRQSKMQAGLQTMERTEE